MKHNADAFAAMDKMISRDVCRTLRVPPWLVDPRIAVPRHHRAAWIVLRGAWWLEERVLKTSATPADHTGGPVPTTPARHTPQPSEEDT